MDFELHEALMYIFEFRTDNIEVTRKFIAKVGRVAASKNITKHLSLLDISRFELGYSTSKKHGAHVPRISSCSLGHSWLSWRVPYHNNSREESQFTCAAIRRIRSKGTWRIFKSSKEVSQTLKIFISDLFV